MNRPILILSPHTDDAELGCGGTIARLASEGEVIYVKVFADCSTSNSNGWDGPALRKECEAALSVLGVGKDYIEFLDFPVRNFLSERQRILDSLVRMSFTNPKTVFIPCKQDKHQDHQVVSREAGRAFKHCTVLEYELLWNLPNMQTEYFVELSSANLEAKVKALSCYATQQNRSYFSHKFIVGLARARGVQSGLVFAESFQVERIVV